MRRNPLSVPDASVRSDDQSQIACPEVKGWKRALPGTSQKYSLSNYRSSAVVVVSGNMRTFVDDWTSISVAGDRRQ